MSELFPSKIESLRPAEDWLWHLRCVEVEMQLMRTAGIIEVSVRNPSVAEYMRHWEGRTSKAEAEVKRLRAALDAHDQWLASTGHGADHPWRLSIARTLAGETGN